MTEIDSFELASAIASRICHDLISPIGAISNGLELMQSESDEALHGQALELLDKSAASAIGRLKFFRLAFGYASGLGDEISADEMRRLIQGIFTNFDCEPVVESDAAILSKSAARLILNQVLIVEGLMVRGGDFSLKIAREDERIKATVSASGNGVAPDAAIFEAMRTGSNPGDKIEPRMVPVILSRHLMSDIQASIDARITGDHAAEITVEYAA